MDKISAWHDLNNAANSVQRQLEQYAQLQFLTCPVGGHLEAKMAYEPLRI